MLLKLFRHDFRALARWQVPVIIGIGGAALLGFLNMLLLGWSDVPYGEQSAGRNMMRTTAVGGTVLVFMALLIAATVAAVLLFVRFYKSMVTDEAYLTFTLPVTAGQLIGAKFLSALVWTVIAGAVIAASWGVIFGGVMISGGADFREGIGEIIKEILEAIGENFGTAFLIGLYMAASLIRGWFQITCAILFGASVVRKNKALAAVGMVFAVNFAVNLILGLFNVSSMFPVIFGGAVMGDFEVYMDFESLLWIQTGVNAVLIAVFWWWSWRLAKKSVNIE